MTPDNQRWPGDEPATRRHRSDQPRRRLHRRPRTGSQQSAAAIPAGGDSAGRAWLRRSRGGRTDRSDLRLLAPLAALLLSLAGCTGELARPLPELERALEQAGSSRAPALGETVLALISGRGGREQVLLVDLRSRLPIPVPGLNRPDAQPLSVASDARGERLALVRHRQGRTELVLYRRSLASLEPIALQPDGVPRRVAIDPEGRSLAVEVSRDGLWQLDLITLP